LDVIRCVLDFPVAVEPLWQVTQAPVTAAWSKRAGVQAAVVWQVSQVFALWTWVSSSRWRSSRCGR